MRWQTYQAMVVGALIGVPCVPTAAHADSEPRAALQAACFAPSALSAVPGERAAVRRSYQFDRTPKTDVALAPFTPVPANQRGAIRRVDLPKGEKLIALTFDLCEQRGEIAGYDGDVFDYLRRENIRATVFAGGKWMRSHAARTEQLLSDPLFEIANHGDTHQNLRLADGPMANAEILGPQRAYEAARRRLSENQCAAPVGDAMRNVPSRLSLFRFPYGACNATTLAAVNDAGLLAIQWDMSSGDPDPSLSAQAIAAGIIRRVKPGSIIVAHGNGRGWNMAAALPVAIPKLKALGYQFVTVSELLARGTPVIADSCYDSRPGDTDRYDFPVSLTAKAKSKTSSATALDLPWLESPSSAAAPRRAADKAKTKGATAKARSDRKQD